MSRTAPSLIARIALLAAVALAAAAVLACNDGEPGPGEPTITPIARTPRETAERWLSLWQEGRYDAMYDIVSPSVQSTIDRQTFVERYEAITDEARIDSLDWEIRTEDRAATLVEFRVEFHSDFFGDIPQVNEMQLVQEEVVVAGSDAGDNRTETLWRVEWSPSLFFTQLTDRTLVHFFAREPRRGSIFDRNGEPLAFDADQPVIGIVPDLVADKEATVSALAGLGVSETEAREAVNTDLPSYYFIPVETLPYDAPDEEVQGFRDLVDLGVVVRETSRRLYPYNDSAAHVIGYMTEVTEEQLVELAEQGFQPGDLIGADGLEGQYNDVLSGERGGLLATITPEGTVDQTIAERASVPGNDIWLTINIDVQKRAEAELGEQTGAIVVMDPRDNSVLALVSYPRFDPNAFIRGLTDEEANAYFNDPAQPFLNRPTLALYPPGSTFKPVTMAAGLEKGPWSTGSTIHCEPVWDGLGEDFAQRNWQDVDRGWLTPAEGLMASCNPVFFEIAKSLDEIDEDLFPDFIRQFGYGSITGIGIPEAEGNVPDPAWKEEVFGEDWFRGDAVNMGIGQGFVTATPLQITNVFSALALSGDLRKPLLISRIGEPGGAVAREFQAEVIHQLPVSQETLDSIRYGLYLVTQTPGGTSYQAWAGTSLDVAGKSGTAEDLAQGSDHVFFAAYANRSDPTIVALGALEEGESGSSQVAPMLRRLMEAYVAGELGDNKPLYAASVDE